MDDFNKRIQEEVDRNYDFFKKEFKRIVVEHLGQFALLKDAAVVDYFDTFEDAEKYANLAFPDLLYSIQKVADVKIKLGFIGTQVYA